MQPWPSFGPEAGEICVRAMADDNPAPTVPKQLTLRSRLVDLAPMYPWVDALAQAYNLPDSTRYAIQLCLEEALTNVVRHGYRGDPEQTVTVQFERRGEREMVFSVEDSAPHFRPFDPSEPLEEPAPVTLETVKPGGQGIRLMRKFSNFMEWEPLEHGNRLRISFVVPDAGQET